MGLGGVYGESTGEGRGSEGWEERTKVEKGFFLKSSHH